MDLKIKIKGEEMKKLLSLAIVLSGISFGAIAQEGVKKMRSERPVREKKEWVNRTPEKMAKQRTEKLDKTLNFTDKQREEVYKFQLDKAKDHKQIFEKRAKERKENRAQMKTQQEEFEKLLTAEQKQLLKENTSKRDHSKSRKGKTSLKRHSPVDTTLRIDKNIK